MITPSLIYTIATILLALTDAIRIKIRWGKTGNINHKVSVRLAAFAGGCTLGWWIVESGIYWNWWSVLACTLVGISFIAIRVVLYDPMLNFSRIIMKTNPTMRIDYESPTTSSYIDNHSQPMPFWLKRIMGVAGWVVIWLLYKVIFKV
jgi:hypothetical protein